MPIVSRDATRPVLRSGYSTQSPFPFTVYLTDKFLHFLSKGGGTTVCGFLPVLEMSSMLRPPGYYYVLFLTSIFPFSFVTLLAFLASVSKLYACLPYGSAERLCLLSFTLHACIALRAVFIYTPWQILPTLLHHHRIYGHVLFGVSMYA